MNRCVGIDGLCQCVIPTWGRCPQVNVLGVCSYFVDVRPSHGEALDELVASVLARVHRIFRAPGRLGFQRRSSATSQVTLFWNGVPLPTSVYFWNQL